jgi:hypothetical protein
MSETSAPRTIQALRARMDQGLAHFLAALDRLSDDQITGPTDAAGWTVRDHLTHLAVWADGVAALLRREDRWAAMGAAPDLTSGGPGDEFDYDAINAVIAARHHDLSAAEARALIVAAHGRLAAALERLQDADLAAPYERFVAPFSGDAGRPIAEYIAGNSYDHYEEHLAWLLAIVEGR